jgi:hypothetical protein
VASSEAKDPPAKARTHSPSAICLKFIDLTIVRVRRFVNPGYAFRLEEEFAGF